MPVTPKLLSPSPDSMPLSRQVFAANAVVYGGAGGLNIGEQVIAAGSAVKSPVVNGVGFDRVELVADVAGSGANIADMVMALVICDWDDTELTEVVVGQMSGTQGIGMISGTFPGLDRFKVKLYGADGGCYLHKIYWLKLSKL